MHKEIELWRKIIRQSVRESIGHGMSCSVKDAARVTGLYDGTIYQIADGRMAQPEKHLLRLMDIPEFADRLMAHRGHACTFIGNEDGCPRKAIASVMSATGEAARIIADNRITNPEEKRLADVLHVVVAKSMAFLSKFKRRRAGVA